MGECGTSRNHQIPREFDAPGFSLVVIGAASAVLFVPLVVLTLIFGEASAPTLVVSAVAALSGILWGIWALQQFRATPKAVAQESPSDDADRAPDS